MHGQCCSRNWQLYTLSKVFRSTRISSVYIVGKSHFFSQTFSELVVKLLNSNSVRVEEWKNGRLEECKIGRVYDWKSGRLEMCKIGRVFVGSIFFEFLSKLLAY